MLDGKNRSIKLLCQHLRCNPVLETHMLSPVNIEPENPKFIGGEKRETISRHPHVVRVNISTCFSTAAKARVKPLELQR